MQNRKGNYEKVLLILASLLALATAGFLIWKSQSFDQQLVRLPAKPKNDPGAPPMAEVDLAIKRLGEKVTWLSPLVADKPVPLNKSIRILQKADGTLIDIQKPEPKLRPPMTNEFLVKYELPDIVSPNVGDLDPDQDGFSNLEEFTANTNPRDAASHPPFTDKLFLARRIAHDYIIKLNNGEAPFQVQRLKPEPKVSKFVSPNEEFGFERGVVRFKVGAFEKKVVPDPGVGEKDVSELTMKDLATNQEFKLVRGTEFNLAEYEAEFEFVLRDRVERRTVKKGETFQIPGLGVTYRVLEIEENKATIAPINADGSQGEPLVVPKR
jgi:hypothetical protein